MVSSRRFSTVRSRPSPRPDERGSAVVDFALVSPLVLLLVLGLMQLALVLHARSVLACAAEQAVALAAAQNGDTIAGERRFRQLVGQDVRQDAISSVTWAYTLDTLTLRVRSRLPLVGPLGAVAMTTDASAFHEAWP